MCCLCRFHTRVSPGNHNTAGSVWVGWSNIQVGPSNPLFRVAISLSWALCIKMSPSIGHDSSQCLLPKSAGIHPNPLSYAVYVFLFCYSSGLWWVSTLPSRLQYQVLSFGKVDCVPYLCLWQSRPWNLSWRLLKRSIPAWRHHWSNSQTEALSEPLSQKVL